MGRRLSFTVAGNGSSKGIEDSIYELKEVHNTIKYDWPQLMNLETNPIELAISLLDDSSVGMAHKLHEFRMLKDNAETALRNVVEEHYELFNNSVGSYHMLLSALRDSQEDASQIKSFLDTSNKEIHDRSALLSDLSSTSAKYSKLIEILDAMDEINEIPNLIDKLIIEKKIHEIYDVISDGYKKAEKYNLWALPALSGLKDYLEQQSNKLFDMIIEELQNEIYFKYSRSKSMNNDSDIGSVFSWENLSIANNSQLSSLTALMNSSNLEQYVYNSANLDFTEIVEFLSHPSERFLHEQLVKLHKHNSQKKGVVDFKLLLESTSNSTMESYSYIYMLLSTASKLSKLDQVSIILTDTVQTELRELINRITEEIKSRNGQAITNIASLQVAKSDSFFDLLAHSGFSDSNVVILEELFGTIFIKCLSVLQKHEVIDQVIYLIENGQVLEKNKEMTSKTMRIVWNILTKEIKILMMNYIYDKNISYSDSKVENTTKEQDTTKKSDDWFNLFQFQDVNYDSASKNSKEIYDILTDVFPGFNLTERTNSSSSESHITPYIKNETFNAMVEVLVPKSLINMRIVLDFFLVFVAGSQRVLNGLESKESKRSELSTLQPSYQFYNEFMKNSFLYNLQVFTETILSKHVGGNYSKESKKVHPQSLILKLVTLKTDSQITIQNELDSNTLTIYENATNFRRLFLEMCSMFNTSLHYRDEYSGMLLDILTNYAKEYLKLYYEVLSINENHADNSNSSHGGSMSQISKWMNKPSLIEVSGYILQSNVSKREIDEENLVKSETKTLLELSSNDINKTDFLSKENYFQAINVYSTSSWILSWLPSIRKESNYIMDDDSQQSPSKISAVDKLRYNWSFLENGRSFMINDNVNSNQNNLYFALDSKSIPKFDEIVSTFESIRDRIILALRYELRCRAMHYIQLSCTQIDWAPSTEPGEPDQYIIKLKQEISSIDDCLTKSIDNYTKELIFKGFNIFLNNLIIKTSYKIMKINSNGIKRILINIAMLRSILQNLSIRSSGVIDFSTSSVYFESFTLNEFTLLNRMKSNEQGYSKEEYKNLARLIYSEKLADGKGSQFNRNKYSDLLNKIEDFI